MKAKFPKVIHITQEIPRNDDPFFIVQEDGIIGIEKHGTEVAIYRLEKVGRVDIFKSFKEQK